VRLILHIVPRVEWETAETAGDYRASSLETEGFIHCSTPEQVIGVANERFHGRSDLALLCIDPARLDAPLVYEDCYESGQEFPHVYGPLNLSAVVAAVDFPPGVDGNFTLPDEVEALAAQVVADGDTVWLCETERDIMLMSEHAPDEVESG
jgi:uncharacterized protein (DUF952 family)